MDKVPVDGTQEYVVASFWGFIEPGQLLVVQCKYLHLCHSLISAHNTINLRTMIYVFLQNGSRNN